MTSTCSLEGRVTRAERQNVLLGAYGFQCRCDACALDDALVEKEDQLRKEATYSPRFGESSLDWCWTKAYYVQAWQLTQPKRCGESELLARAERLLQIRVQLQFKVQQDILCWERSLINVYLETKWKTWCIWRLRLAGVRILQMLNNKTSAYPPTWHLGCGLGTCPTCWVWRAGYPGRF